MGPPNLAAGLLLGPGQRLVVAEGRFGAGRGQGRGHRAHQVLAQVRFEVGQRFGFQHGVYLGKKRRLADDEVLGFAEAPARQ